MMRPKAVAGFAVWLFLATAITTPSLIAQDEVTSSALDLKYESLGLVNTVTDVEGAGTGLNKSAQDVAGQIQGMEVKETDLEIKINLAGDILFDFDKADLRPAAEPVLAQVVAQIQKYPRGKVLIEGHTDSKGNQPYNLKLSDRRAASVKNWLAARGIAAKNITTRGWGSTKPAVPNSKADGSDDPDGRQKNRRVELTIKK